MVGLSAHFRFVQALAVAQFQGRYAGVRGGGLKEGRDKVVPSLSPFARAKGFV